MAQIVMRDVKIKPHISFWHGQWWVNFVESDGIFVWKPFLTCMVARLYARYAWEDNYAVRD